MVKVVNLHSVYFTAKKEKKASKLTALSNIMKANSPF